MYILYIKPIYLVDDNLIIVLTTAVRLLSFLSVVYTADPTSRVFKITVKKSFRNVILNFTQ